MAYHLSNGEYDGFQPSDGPSLVPWRYSPFSLWATEVLMDHQASDAPSRQPSLVPWRYSPFSLWAAEVLTDHQASDAPPRQPSPRPKVQVVLVKKGRRAD
ncbi:hypothetical protein HAX54_043384 [Datura stramonium]|uniref:Uncharacterized protein n=1 Tax=Datura stramonium TaxID=4076 RepID=A0ABS8W322_DATST|nr:hypothetical protein [Datura stramonium]